ncbi:MAG: BREX-3 system phosphatase PglZ [Deltaproteobacteria bacterium]|nr:BREX-3 system phosphatase PglZ [Deltaproteobacteria bacterium]
MSAWREAILAQLPQKGPALALVADPDRLLQDARLLDAVRARGVEVVRAEEPVAFRYAYDASLRPRLDRGEDVRALVVVGSDAEARALPCDVLALSQSVRGLGLAALCPRLSYPALRELDPQTFDAVIDAHAEYTGAPLGDQATREFVLKRVYRIDPEAIHTAADVACLLLEKHTRALPLPAPLDAELVRRLSARPALAGWLLSEWMGSREAFLRAVQGAWPGYLAERAGRAAAPAGGLRFPFDDDAVRRHVDTLFLDGVLRPVPFDAVEDLPSWARAGVEQPTPAAAIERLDRQLMHARAERPPADAHFSQWLAFARTWAAVVAARARLDGPVPADVEARYDEAQADVDAAFAAWMEAHYASLANVLLPGMRPVMVHQVAGFLARQRAASARGRVALLVIDGMALDQWLTLREGLGPALADAHLDESAIFAWVPTVTSVSRQALFAGRTPLYFGESLFETGRDEARWRRAWHEAGVAPEAVRYARAAEAASLETVGAWIEHPKVAVVGLVLNTIDDSMHGAVLGLPQLHGAVRLWVAQGGVGALIARLLDGGFEVFVTADHGNTEAVGGGRLSEGVLVDKAGERARCYASAALRARALADAPAALPWPGVGLPPSVHVLLAPDRQAFLPPGERRVVHGGIVLEEVVVPFVRIFRQ